MAHPLPSGLTRPTPRTAITCATLAAGVVFGGGGSSAPGSELLLQLAVAAAAIAWLLMRRDGDRNVDPRALILAALVLTLPLVQLIPLPPAVWHNLPGSSLERAVLGLVGEDGGWRAWTVSTPQTWAALLATIPAAFVGCVASTLDRDGRRAALATIAALGFVSLLLGALQLADGVERTWRFYADNAGYLNGFQANRNAEADILLIAFAALACLLVPRDDRYRGGLSPAWLAGAGGLALLLGCVLTGSRAGIAIALPVIGIAAWQWRAPVMRARRVALAAAGVVVLGLCLVLVQGPGSALALVVDRFTWQRDVRLDLWRDTVPVLHSLWPAGSGLGTFRAMFIAGEPLSSVDPTRPVRAHDDYLEFALEGGVFAVVVLVAVAGLLGVVLLRAMRPASSRDRPTLAFIAATFVVIALHSLVDYPLRTMSLAILGAGAAGMLFAIARDAGGHARSPEAQSESAWG